MSGISSVSSSTSSIYYSPLDTNKDGIVDQQELQAAAKSGATSANVSGGLNTDDANDTGASNKFSGNLVDMLLQQMQQLGQSVDPETINLDDTSTAGTGASPTSTSTTASTSTAASTQDTSAVSTDAASTGSAEGSRVHYGVKGSKLESDIEQLIEGLSSLLNQSTAATSGSNTSQSDPSSVASSQTSDSTNDGLSGSSSNSTGGQLNIFLQEIQSSLAAYENTYGQYDFGSSATSDVSNVAS